MTVAPTDAAEVIELWPAGPPTVLEGVGEEVAYEVQDGVAKGTTFYRNVSEPTLTVFTPPTDRRNGRGAVIAPGGGWTINAYSHEGLDVAGWLVEEGYTAFLLKYRVQRSGDDQARFEERMKAMDTSDLGHLPKLTRPAAISDLISTERYLQARAAAADDGRRAIEIARERAAAYGVDPTSIGMIGFSAGAFLAVDVALDPQADQLAWIAPIYGGETRGLPVPADAPPLFTAVAADDVLVRIVEGVHADWSSAGRPSEMHVFARGGHGFGMVEQGAPSDRWTDLLVAWLGDL